MKCPYHGVELKPIATSEHYRCLRCFEENDGDDCEFSALLLVSLPAAGFSEDVKRFRAARRY